LQLLCNELDEGEAQAIVLAKELNVDILIIDERLGYKIAQSQ
jgi:predicted nucleic acid-binding protein